MIAYPLIVRNRMPWLGLGLMLLWCAGLVLWSIETGRHETSASNDYLPYILALMWTVSLISLTAAIRQEHGVIAVERPGLATVIRGPFYRRIHSTIDRLALKMEKDWDSEGGAHFKLLLIDGPTPLIIAEGHRRDRLDQIKADIEAAFAG